MSVLAWLNDPPSNKGMYLFDRHGVSWRFHSYESLALLARRAARRLRLAGVRPGDVVVIVRSGSAEFVADFYGAILVGATPSAIAPPDAFHDRSAYTDHLARVIRLMDPRVVSTTVEALPIVQPAIVDRQCRVMTCIDDRLAPLDGAPTPPRVAMVQFSSGSTGPPRGIQIPFLALESNLSALRESIQMTGRDAFASWLPVHHDMGLVGHILLPFSAQCNVWLMQPGDFIRSPRRWLRAFGPGGATLTATPTFGLAHVVRRVRAEQLTGLDLSGWRGIVVGAERVEAEVVRSFLELLAPCGLRPEALVPAYGLAESTLAVTVAPLGSSLSTVTVDSQSVVVGRPVVTVSDPTRGTTLVGCGRPVRGVSVRVVDENGGAVAADVLGEIEIGGTSLAARRVSEEDGEEPMADRLRTGDAGFIHNGDLFVVGRMGDAIKQFGRWFFAEDAEQIAVVHSPRPRQTVVIMGSLTGRNTVAVLAEGTLDGAAGRIGRAVARHLSGLRVLVLTVRSGEIARTTSGKPKRRAMWSRLANGELEAAICWDSEATVDATPVCGDPEMPSVLLVQP